MQSNTETRKIQRPTMGRVVLVNVDARLCLRGRIPTGVTPAIVTAADGGAYVTVALIGEGCPEVPHRDEQPGEWIPWGESRPGVPAPDCWCYPAICREEVTIAVTPADSYGGVRAPDYPA